MDLIASSLYGAWIVSPKALEAAAADDTYFESGIDGGTGPYTLESWVPDGEVLLTPFPDYWGGWDDVDHYDKVLVTIMPEAVDQQQALDGGAGRHRLQPALENLDQYEANPDFTVMREPSLFNYVGLLNTQTSAPRRSRWCAQALAYATPYDDIIEVGAQGFGTQARGPVPAGVFPYSETPRSTRPTWTRPRRSWTRPASTASTWRSRTPPRTSTRLRFAPLLQDAYGQLGVNVTLDADAVQPAVGARQGRRRDGRQDMFLLLYWPTYSDAGSDNLWSLFHSSDAPFFNLSYWADEQYDSLIDEAGGQTASTALPRRRRTRRRWSGSWTSRRASSSTTRIFPAAIPKRIAGYQYNLNYPFAQSFYPLHPGRVGPAHRARWTAAAAHAPFHLRQHRGPP